MTANAFSPAALAGKRVLVLGLGRFSGGVETARFLARVGARCRIADTATRAALEESAAAAEALGAELVFGPQGPDDADALLDDVDAVIASPAIPDRHAVLEIAWARGLPMTTEVSIVMAECPAPVIGVTGTKGKSTTSALLASMLAATGRTTHFGGNIGNALIGSLDTIGAEDHVVLELSSFQLEWARRAETSPHVTVITNLFPDHLDRHGTMEAYAEAKRAALDFQGPGDFAVLPADDAAVDAAGWRPAGSARRITYGDGGDFASWDAFGAELALLGRHNERNALAAAAAVIGAGLGGADAVRDGASNARPLPHRMEPVVERAGVLYVDDSNATNPKSTICALEAFQRPVVVLVGGKDKGIDATELARAIGASARGVVGIGTTGAALVEQIEGIPTAVADSMEDAVERATAMVPYGGVVLLSPGYSSLDEYASFAVRGDAFRAAAENVVRPA